MPTASENSKAIDTVEFKYHDGLHLSLDMGNPSKSDAISFTVVSPPRGKETIGGFSWDKAAFIRPQDFYYDPTGAAAGPAPGAGQSPTAVAHTHDSISPDMARWVYESHVRAHGGTV